MRETQPEQAGILGLPSRSPASGVICSDGEMPVRIALLLFCGLIVCAPSASAEDRGSWHDLDGKPAPAIKVDTWVNAGKTPPSREMLAGRVWLVAFFALH